MVCKMISAAAFGAVLALSPAACLDLLGMEFEDQARAAARFNWSKDGYGAQFDQPPSAIYNKHAA